MNTYLDFKFFLDGPVPILSITYRCLNKLCTLITKLF